MRSVLERIAAAVGLVGLAPLIVVAGALVWWQLGRPILIGQLRPGLHGVPFRLWKLRSMTNATDEDGHLLPDDQRLTRFGRILRASSLDELPQLFNIARGEMAFVGPRPLLMEYLDRYTPEQRRRHDVLPGITGLAQVSGRNDLAWEERFELDCWYVDHRSPSLDLRILLATFGAVLRRRGVAQAGHATVERFDPKREHRDRPSESTRKESP